MYVGHDGAICSFRAQAVIRQNPVALLMQRYTPLQVLLHERIHHQTGGPDAHPYANLALLLQLEGIAGRFVADVALLLEVNGRAASQLFDVMRGLDVDPFALEVLHSIVTKLLVEHAEDCGRYIVDRDLGVLHEIWVQLLHVLLDDVVQLGAPLDACWSAANDSEVQESLFHCFACGGKTGSLEAAEHAVAYPAGIADVFEEVCVLFDAFRAERLRITANRDQQLIIGHVEELSLFRLDLPLLLSLTLGLTRMPVARQRLSLQWVFHSLLDRQSLLLEVDRVCPALEELRSFLTPLAAIARSGGLQGAAELERAGRCRSEERSEDEVGARRDDYYLVLLWVKVAREREAGPSRA